MTPCHTPTERFILPRAKPGWCGVGLAEINLADLGSHWIWSIGFQMHTGDMWGSGGPLWDGDGHRAPTRDDAIAAASAAHSHCISGPLHADGSIAVDGACEVRINQVIGGQRFHLPKVLKL